MENLIEKQIGNYKIAEIIGQGGMGKVYKGLHVSLERTVALKMIHPKFLSNSEIVERFYKEAKIQARLNHPNIVAIYDIIEHDHNHYIVMEYIKGEVISKIIEHQGPFDQETALTIFKQILEGINYAHSKNVIHKDIKTSNFLITPTEVKIMDFGIAEIIGKSEIDTTAGVLGTPKYMSPEQILGREVDHRSDIYSLGICLFEFLTAKTPFTVVRRSDFEIRKAHLEEKPPLVSTINPDVNPKFDNIIHRSLEKEPDNRFGDLDEFTEAIGNSLDYSKYEDFANIQFPEIQTRDNKNSLENDNSQKLSETDFSALLTTIYLQKSTCILHIESDLELKIHFLNGYVNFVECNEPNTFLGQILVNNNKITNKEQIEAMQFVQETGLKIGESLIKLGKITPHELSKTLETQINIKLLNGFKCKKGSYRIIKTTTPSSEPIFKINPMQVIYEAINKFYEDKNLFNRKKFKNGVVFKASDNFNDELNKLTFTTVKHFKLANNISESNNVGDIIKKSPLNKNETFKFLFFLEKAKLIEMEDSKINNSIENEKLSTDPFKDDTVLLTDDQIEEIKSELNNVTS